MKTPSTLLTETATGMGSSDGDVKSVLREADVGSPGVSSENVIVPPGPVVPVGLRKVMSPNAGRPPIAKAIKTKKPNRRAMG